MLRLPRGTLLVVALFLAGSAALAGLFLAPRPPRLSPPSTPPRLPPATAAFTRTPAA